MTRDDVGMVAVIVAIGLAILLAASTLAGSPLLFPLAVLAC